MESTTKTHENCLTWLSFADDAEFLGLVIAPTETIKDGVTWAWENKLNPGGEVMGFDGLYREDAPIEFDIMSKYIGRLVPEKEAQELYDLLEEISSQYMLDDTFCYEMEENEPLYECDFLEHWDSIKMEFFDLYERIKSIALKLEDFIIKDRTMPDYLKKRSRKRAKIKNKKRSQGNWKLHFEHKRKTHSKLFHLAEYSKKFRVRKKNISKICSESIPIVYFELRVKDLTAS